LIAMLLIIDKIDVSNLQNDWYSINTIWIGYVENVYKYVTAIKLWCILNMNLMTIYLKVLFYFLFYFFIWNPFLCICSGHPYSKRVWYVICILYSQTLSAFLNMAEKWKLVNGVPSKWQKSWPCNFGRSCR
jgi:hypothetical protein